MLSEWGWWASCGPDSRPQDGNEAENQEEWVELVKYYNGTGIGTSYTELNKLVAQIKVLELARDPISIPSTSSNQNGKQTAYGMSPKKTHEVLRMSALVESLLSPSRLPGDEFGRPRMRVVDVGAGQVSLIHSLQCLCADSDLLLMKIGVPYSGFGFPALPSTAACT